MRVSFKLYLFKTKGGLNAIRHNIVILYHITSVSLEYLNNQVIFFWHSLLTLN